jgi:N-hydroxyarylamine O-acetyltransferase
VLEEADGIDNWHLVHDPAGGFVGMGWSAAAAEMSAFTVKHQWLSTSPESGFVRVPMAEHRDATGVDVIRGLILTRSGEATSAEPLMRRDDWFACLADVFDLRFEGSAPEALDRLWDRAVAAHREWEAAGPA